ncbi:MFS transporter [Rhizohabitans arisaemae]|uniref:MFS transporter n=1 Tax=Rhizohabitans arisaemae TaxID=2720610 RepID=UPI0024B258F1|nr:MFS transporter [Rhizohabitans arisaemae]
MTQTSVDGRYRDALAIPEFRAIFISHVVSMLGTVITEFSLMVLVYERTQSPFLSALVFTLGFSPHLFGGTLLNALVDRVPIRRLLVGSNLVTALLSCAMAIPGIPIVVLLLLAFCVGLVAPVFSGARSATLPDVLPDHAYIPGRSLFRLVAQLTLMAGFTLTGLLLTAIEPHLALLIVGACFLLSAAVLRFGTKERATKKETQGSLLRDSLSGLRRVMAVPPLRRILLLGWWVPALAIFPSALAVPYTRAQGFDTFALGLFLTAMPIGSVIGELFGVWLKIRRIIPLAVCVFLPQLMFATEPGLWLSIAILAVSGIGFAHHLGLDRRLIEAAPENLRSRALSLQSAGLMFWQGLGFAVAGAAAEFADPTVVIPVSAVIGLVCVIALRRTEHSSL